MDCTGLLCTQCILYCTGRQFYPMSLIDRNIDIKNIVCFGVLTPQTWFKMNKVAFLGLIIWKRRRAATLLMPDLNSTPKNTPRHEFSELWGFHNKFMALSTSSFIPRHVFDSDSPKFLIEVRKNDRDYDAQNFRIFISHHYLPPHLKRKKSMTWCSAHPRCWHGIALFELRLYRGVIVTAVCSVCYDMIFGV